MTGRKSKRVSTRRVQKVTEELWGLKAAFATVFRGVAWQRCQCQIQRNAQSYVSKIVMKRDMAEDLRSIFNAPTMPDAEQTLKTVLARYQDSEPGVTVSTEENSHEGVAVLSFPASHRRHLRTSNAVETDGGPRDIAAELLQVRPMALPDQRTQ
ncbi:Transposase, Mutator family [Planctomycetes bacterium Poly30]|uniref:Mutator family transposase n=1 Tax=Saltatorellus ferox TaxID=2528018 RepID=A0A518EZ67_9BACT|nr:Transposase, Mutator family [Planctomycetes bacterium Poly30]